MKKLRIYIIMMVLCLPGCLVAQTKTRFHNEATDTSRITRMLVEVSSTPITLGEAMVRIGESFLGTPYVGGTLEGLPETLTVDLDEFDCTTFVETVAALAITVNEHRTSWRDFVYNLGQLRYRNGSADGYGSRLHYFSDWVVNNTHRGALREVTDRIGAPATYAEKTLDFMTANADKYPALADSASLAAVKNIEIGFRRHRFPFIKTVNIGKGNLADGDIVAITSSLKNLDVTHMGIVKHVDGKPYLLHASSKAGKVVIDELPLADYVRRNRTATGIRVIRLQQ